MKKYKLMLGFLFSISMLFSVSALETTTSNPTSYYCDAGVDSCELIFDDDWTTKTFNPGGTTGNVYMNYSKPLNAESSTWDIKIGISAMFAQQTGKCWDGSSWVVLFSDSLAGIPPYTNTRREYSIPQACFDQEPIQLKVVMDSQTGKFVYFFEEQMKWETDSEEIVGYGETIQLPQLISDVPIDETGLERTYLYCTWQIDGNGEQAIMMDSQICPDPQEEFTFQNDETYYRRIDRADIFWNTTDAEWQVSEIGLVDEATTQYILNIPEPPQSLFDDIFDTIYNTIRNIICQIFPWLGMCNP